VPERQESRHEESQESHQVDPEARVMIIRRRRLIVTPLLTLAALGLLALTAAPALAAAPETPETGKASAITSTTATLEDGVLNPNAPGEVGEYQFLYRVSETDCEGESAAPEPAGTALGNEKEVVPPVKLTGLQPNAKYTFCLIERNAAEEQSPPSTPVTFKTLAAKPAVDSESTPVVTPFEATLEALLNPNNQGTVYSFQYSTDASGETLEGSIATVEGTSLLSGFGEQSASVSTGAVLTPNTTYYYRVLATNATGTTEGEVKIFTTAALEKPLIDGESVTGVTQTNAELHALINPNYQETEYQFRLGTDTSYGLGPVPATAVGLGGAGFFGDLEAIVNLHTEGVKLEPNTEYHYEAVATNASGSTEGLVAQGDQTFLTLPNPPTAITGQASSITPNGATISGAVNPGSVGPNSQTTYFFQYGPSTSYGAQAPLAPGDAGEGTSPVIEAANLSELEPGVRYHYRIVATNDNANTPQSAFGEDETFTTVATPPILSAVSVSALTQSSVTITATLDPRGLPTRYELQLGSAPGALQAQAFGNTAGVLPLTLTVGSLSPGTLYYYKLIATNLNGTSEPEGTFTTAPGPGASSPLTQPPTPPLLTTPAIAFPSEPTAGAPVKKSKALTIKQKLARDLKNCARRPKKQRASCRRSALSKYNKAQRRTGKNR
jgi:hypothetical protein